MGLFALPLGQTKIDHIKSLECNVDIWLRYAERNEDLDYLLGFMQMCLDKARACAKQRVGLVTKQHQSLVSKQHQPKTKIDHIKALKANIDLWLHYAEKDTNLDYLFNFMQICLNAAKISKI